MTASPRMFRRNARALGASAAAAVLVLGIAGPVQSEEAIAGTGTSSVSLVPVDLTLDGIGVPLTSTLGSLTAEATNVDDALASLRFGSIGAAGDTAPGFEVSSADGDRSGDESRAVEAAGIGAALGLVDYAVSSDEGTATARLATLAAELTTPLGLDPVVDAQQVIAAATATGTDGGLALSLGQLELGLGDLLPPELLEALPLSVVIDLADQLGLPLPADLLDRLSDLDDLTGTLQGAIDAADDIEEIEALIADVVAELPEVVAAEAAVTDALASVADATATVDAADALVGDLEDQLGEIEAEIASIEGQIATLTASLLDLDSVLDALQIASINGQIATLTSQLGLLQTEATTLETQLADADEDLADATSALAAAETVLDGARTALAGLLDDVAALDPELAALLDQLAGLEDLLTGVIDELAGLLDGADLPELRLDLVDALLATPLLDLGALTVDLASVADGAGGTGSASCTAAGLTVLGSAIPSPDCAAIATAIDQLDTAIADALSALPIASTLPGVLVSGLDVTSSGSDSPVDGVSSSFARVSALTLGIESLDLTAVVDDLVSELDGLIGQLDDRLGAIGLLDLDVVQLASAPDFTASAVDVPLDLDGALTDLRATLDLLPLGDALAGLSTIGLEAVLGGGGVESVFTAASAGAPVTPGTPATPGAPGSPSTPETPATPLAPGTPTGGPVPGTSLPRTGDSIQLLAAAALAAMAAGGVTLMLGRSVALGMHRVPSRVRPTG